ncbi:MAG: hypothetical protein E8D52_11600 [Nitrospira sp.]|nr:MAG: hypothetical protein E8D52_11600 [Nitrospira sp.]
MRLTTHCHPSLPQLAWVAVVDKVNGIVTLRHGAKVEVRDSLWIEGVWDGPFEKGDFGETDCVFGTGGRMTGESVRFVSSASTTDYLYYRTEAERVTVSNSLPLLLTTINDRLDPLQCRTYARACDSIMNGLNDYQREMQTVKGSVRRLMYRNLEVSSDKILETEKRMPPRFHHFEDYRQYLRERYASIVANARDGARTWPLPILSTQSKGYDSTAVNALAAPYGIDRVFTVTQAKSTAHLAHQQTGPLQDDDGSAICDVLGLRYTQLARDVYTRNFDDESLFYTALHLSQDANLLGVKPHVSTVSLLLTGTLGEIWYPRSTSGDRAHVDTDIRRWDLGGHGLSEWRLVVGLIHLPLPYIGARRKADILAMTESPEMNPWRMWTKYDRPIPRRIAEEAGVPRQLFGQSKLGSVVLFCHPAVPYGEGLRRSFFASLVQQHLLSSLEVRLWPLVRWWNTTMQVKTARRFALLHYGERAVSKLLRRPYKFPLLWMKLEGALFCFCVNRTAEQYKKSVIPY